MNPQGKITIQTIAMPADTNACGDIFGGWLVSQMDLAAGVLAKKLAQGRVVTVAIHSMTFLKPVHIGDVISCYVKLIKKGRTSLTIAVEVWTEPSTNSNQYQVTEGIFVFIAIDKQGIPREVINS